MKISQQNKVNKSKVFNFIILMISTLRKSYHINPHFTWLTPILLYGKKRSGKTFVQLNNNFIAAVGMKMETLYFFFFTFFEPPFRKKNFETRVMAGKL